MLEHLYTYVCYAILQIKKYAFSGGKDTVEEHHKTGGDTTIDVSYQYLSFFLDDDEKLEKIKKVASYDE